MAIRIFKRPFFYVLLSLFVISSPVNSVFAVEFDADSDGVFDDTYKFDVDNLYEDGAGLAANVLSILKSADYAAIKALLDLEIGTDVAAAGANSDITSMTALTSVTINGSINKGEMTVAEMLALTPAEGWRVTINDGDTSCDQAVGLGTSIYDLRHNGVSWVCVGDGASDLVAGVDYQTPLVADSDYMSVDGTWAAAPVGGTLDGRLVAWQLPSSAYIFADTAGNPSTVGQLKYVNDAVGLADGAFAWYSGTEVRHLLDYVTLPTVDGQTPVYNSTTDKWVPSQKNALPVTTKTAAYTIGTDSLEECYGGVVYVTSAATITACDNLAAGMSFTVVTIGAIAVSVDVQADDLMYLDGTALDDGDKATNTSTTGDTLTCIYYNATGWFCWSGSPDGDHWTDGGA